MKKMAWGVSCLAPTFYIPWKSLDRDILTPNMEQREKDAQDPLLWHYGIRAGFAVALFKAADETNAKFSEYSTPTSEAPIRCDGCGIAQFTVLRTFPHNLLFSAHFRTFCNFLHISA